MSCDSSSNVPLIGACCIPITRSIGAQISGLVDYREVCRAFLLTHDFDEDGFFLTGDHGSTAQNYQIIFNLRPDGSIISHTTLTYDDRTGYAYNVFNPLAAGGTGITVCSRIQFTWSQAFSQDIVTDAVGLLFGPFPGVHYNIVNLANAVRIIEQPPSGASPDHGNSVRTYRRI